MSTLTINWHFVFEGVLLISLAFAVLVCAIIAIAYLTKGKAGVAAILRTAETDTAKFAASPIGHTVVVDLEKLAAQLAPKLMSAPPVTIAGHPTLTAAVDAVEQIAQKSAAVKQAVAELTAATSAVPQAK